MDVQEILSNKWVWIGGAGLVVLLLASRGGSSGGTDTAYLSYLSAANAQGAQQVSEGINAAMQEGIARSNNDASVTSSIVNAISNLSEVNALYLAQYGQTQSGVISAIATADAAANAQGIVAGAGAVSSVAAARASVDTARINAAAATSIAKTQANASLWSNIANTVGGVASAAIKASGA